MQRRRPPLSREDIGQARKGSQHDHILLKPPDKARVRDELLLDARSVEQGHDPVCMALDLSRNLLPHEGTFRIPPQHYMAVRLVPHQRQRIKLTIERALFIHAAG